MTDFDVESLFNRRADRRWDRTAVGDILERVAVARPDAEAFVGLPGAFASSDFERLTYRQADEWANRFANALLDRGLVRGDRVLMACENSIEAMVIKFGVAKAGCVAVPINPRQVADFVAHALALTRPALVIADEQWADVPVRAGRDVDAVLAWDGEAGSTGLHPFCAAASSSPPEVTIHGDDIWQLLFTSGTTAMPKAVMISHNYSYLLALSWVPTLVRGLRHESHLRLATCAPVAFHVGDQGFILPSLLSGGTAIMGRRWDPVVLARAVRDERATLVHGGAHRLAMELLTELERLGSGAGASLTGFLHATGLLEPRELARIEALSDGISVTYLAGQTESCTSHRFVYDVSEERYARAVADPVNVVGPPTPLLASVVIDVDEPHEVLDHGAVGELVYRSPVMTPGYFRDPAATEEAFAGGWFHSGDLGTTEPAGDRTMNGRLKDLIKTGGENVAAIRVEQVLLRHPGVADVAVIGLPDERWGEEVVAVVVAEQGVACPADELIAFARAQLAGFETPKRVIFADELPLGVGAKVLKHELRRRYRTLKD